MSGCSKVDDSPVNSFIDKTWQLQSNHGRNETVVFSKDSTYTMTTDLSPLVLGYPSSAIHLKGLWQYENGQITFKTANLELPDSNWTVPQTPVTIGQSIGSFYGYLSDSLLNSDTVINLSYVPIVWTIKELTSSKLTVQTKNETLIYISKKM